MIVDFENSFFEFDVKTSVEFGDEFLQRLFGLKKIGNLFGEVGVAIFNLLEFLENIVGVASTRIFDADF